VNFHSLAGLGRLACLNGSQNFGMPNPARHCLRAKGIETSHIVERQIQLTCYASVAGELRQPPVKLSIGAENIRQDRSRAIFRRNDDAEFA
jgi:hypothetical protein